MYHSKMVIKLSLKRTQICILISALVCTTSALGAPHVGEVVHGNAQINQQGNVTNILQNSGKAAINWQGFSVGANEVVNFHQPGAASVILNRVVGNERSVIQGALNANGQVFLINSNGILFTRGSQVNTAGFVASTLGISDKDFAEGNYTFTNNGKPGASVINMGTIQATDGGYVALLGQQVSNQGIIIATKGTAALSSGDKITLNFNGNSLINVSIDQGTLDALVENKQAIYADGGQVILTAKAAGDILSAQVNNTGLIQAQTLGDLKGDIYLNAIGGTANINGTLDASAPTTGDGGFIETSGDRVKIADTTHITTKSANGQTGTWLIDPTDFTIAATGGDITGTNLSNQLNNNSVHIQSQNGAQQGQGNIYVNDSVTWGADTTLTLTADNDIHINKSITATGDNAGLTLNAGWDFTHNITKAGEGDIYINNAVTLAGANAQLNMNYGGDYNIRTKASYSGTVLDANGKPVAQQDTSGGVYGSITLSGANATLHMNGQEYTLIHSMTDLAAISGTPGYYALAQNLDAFGHIYTDAVVKNLAADRVFAGLGHVVDNLTIDATTGTVGLFGSMQGGNEVRDLGVTNVNISSTSSRVGGLAGVVLPKDNTGTIFTYIHNVYVTGEIYAKNGSAGGLVGTTYDTSINNAFMSGKISGGGDSGGLIGSTYRWFGLKNAHAHVEMDMINPYSNQWTSQQVSSVGGLIGLVYNTDTNIHIANSYATGTIYAEAGGKVGGLIGSLRNGNITNSFAAVDITSKEMGGSSGVKNVGGLIGEHDGGAIDNVWASGDINVPINPAKPNASAQDIGGLIGSSKNGSINNAYAYGDVNVDGKSMTMGGLVGLNYSTITNSHAYGNVNGYTQAGGFVGMNGGHISGSTASGNVTIRQDIGISQAGGFAGNNLAAGTLSDVHASGNVNGFINVGGLAGLNSGTIKDSSSSGEVNGMDGKNVGGLVGTNNGTMENNYWNAENSGKDNAAGNGTGTITGSEGLTNEQFDDLEHYLDGTIDQVLAQREADRLAQIEAERQEAQRQEQFQTHMTAASAVGQGISASHRQFNSVIDEEELLRLISTAPLTPIITEHLDIQAHERSYSADVQRIEVDGVIYELEE